MRRKPIPKSIETEILTSCGRRCALCYGIDGHYGEVYGQVAHLDHDNTNNKLDNLAFLCLEHHSIFDSKTSQHKNYTKEEIKHYRNAWNKYFANNRQLDEPKTSRFDKTRPFCLLFDGINDCLRIQRKAFYSLTDFSLECLFKLFNEKYTGVLMSIDNNTNDSFYYIIYYSTEHPNFPGELHLKYVDKILEVNELLASIRFDKLEWKKIRLTFTRNKMHFELGNQRVSAFYNSADFKMDHIQIGGRIWPNSTGFLACYMSYFKVYDNLKDEVVNELVFDYGEKYLLDLPKIEGMKLIGPQFYKIPE